MTATAPERLIRLRRTNAILGLLHATQGVAVLALGNGFALPVTGSFMEGPPGSGLGESRVLLDVSFAVGVAAFLFISAIAHWLIASPWYFPRYRAGLVAGRNYARWVEYSLSASVMTVSLGASPAWAAASGTKVVPAASRTNKAVTHKRWRVNLDIVATFCVIFISSSGDYRGRKPPPPPGTGTPAPCGLKPPKLSSWLRKVLTLPIASSPARSSAD